ncbi:ATP-binding cassette transporter 1 [Capsaspora owczarzaki ATCC 30864]|uniref:ATP-binding cassette transporter 1 n=1 Tax=Capsaspora owczarzaki (strain ATCC 30864) TaxID=595528 RepID=A0A0D2WM12_CAPO3|nr:ATP-binding cassette transporter 1 [Capsaspora owczarzaki ATCC 30864]KJE91770.1 ATP-binding cassette transporter 1 [Capsaspora owczarzaki ATCC 30864]|eukprot:XP_004363699.2 ATP-binding cassette transporter 1 [Capsaspora owczarzaki ATCC 30864]
MESSEQGDVSAASFSRSAVGSVPLAEMQYARRQSRFAKFRLLMWKNWTIKRRRPFATLVEISLPLFLFIILVLVRHRRLPEQHGILNYSPECMLSNGLSCTMTLTNNTLFTRRDVDSHETDDEIARQLALKRLIELFEFNTPKAHQTTFDEDVSPTMFGTIADSVVGQYSADPLPTAQAPERGRRANLVEILLSKRIIYAPKGGDSDILIQYIKQDIVQSFGSYFPVSFLDPMFVGYDTEAELVERAVGNFDVVCGYALRAMNTSIPGQPRLSRNPGEVKWALRVLPDQTPSTARSMTEVRTSPSGTDTYATRGFIFFQNYMERALTRFLSQKTLPYTNVYMNRFSFPPYTSDGFAGAIATTFPLLMTLSFVYSVSMLVKSIVYEKEQRLKEIMKMMGLSAGVYWSSWYLSSLIMMTISVALACFTIFAGTVLAHSSPSLTFVFMMCFVLSTISLTFLISVFFSRARLAAACAGIIYFMTYLPYVLVQRNSLILSRGIKFFACLCSTTAFGVGATYLAEYERRGDSIDWNTYNIVEFGDNFTFRDAMLMMVVDAILYLTLAWYIEGVAPGKYGVPRPWNFPFTASYWRGNTAGEAAPSSTSVFSRWWARVSNRSRDPWNIQTDLDGGHDGVDVDSLTTAAANNLEPEDCEAEPKGLRKGVDIRRLRKVYENGKVALKNLTLRIYEDQVTALLGHNGAGKTTTMSILTGLFQPTSGTALVNGFDIQTQIDGVRQSLGICPQYNVLFDYLSVRDHMEFYSALKGVEKSYIKADVDAMLKSVGLVDKEHSLAGTLSGGMKRKLSVAIAFIGGSKTVILDEPTAGVDPYARRAIWDLVIRHKAGRSIILSTHYMEEADLLADRIAIVADGQLRCVGASLFLKKRFGIGYHMTLVKRSDATKESDVTAFLRSFVPKVNLTGDIGAELSYTLPSDQSSVFPALFAALEARLAELGISSYGVGVTTLEEVFLRVGDLHEEEQAAADEEESDKVAGSTTRSRKSHMALPQGSNGATPREANGRLEFVSDEDDLAVDHGDDAYETHTNGHGMGAYRTNDDAFAIQLDSLETGASAASRSRSRSASLAAPATTTAASGGPTKKSANRGDKGSAKGGMRLARDFENEVDMASVNHVVVSGLALRLQQLVAMIIKRLHHAKRDKKAVASQLFVPAAFICIAMAIALIYPPPTDLPPLTLDTALIDRSGNMMMYGTFGPNCQPYANNFFQHLLPIVHHIDSYRNMTDTDMQGYVMANNYQMQRSSYGGFTFNNSAPIPGLVMANSTVWYRGEFRHGIATMLNRYHNALLGMLVNAESYQIVTINHAWPTTAQDKANEYRRQGTDLVVGIFIMIAFAFVPASFVLYVVSERQSKSKHMQFVSGVNSASYWIATFVWDLFTFMFPILVALIIFVAFNDEAYSGVNFTAVAILFLLYAWSMTPLMYCLSYLFEVPPTAYVTLICVNLITGITSVIATFMLDLFPDDPELLAINDILKVAFLLLPNYCMGRGIMDLAINQLINQYLATIGQSRFADPLSWDVVGKNVLCMTIEGFVFFALVLIIERTSVSPVYHRLVVRLGDAKRNAGLWLRRVFSRRQEGHAYSIASTGEGESRVAPARGRKGLLNITDTEDVDDNDDNDLPQYVRDLNAQSARQGNGHSASSAHVELQSVGTTPQAESFGILTHDPEGIAMIVEDDDVIQERRRVLALPIEKFTLQDREREQQQLRKATRRAQRAAHTHHVDIETPAAQAQRDIMIVKELGKTFRQGDNVKVAVDHLSVGIKTGECFGLLGVNGAGKTTTFRMLTGDCNPTIGDAFLDGYSIYREQIDVRQRIGYCPQFDALNELLTARELLFMYARLRGLLEPHIPKVVDWCIRKLQLDKYADRPCGTYSGGNKRKLSTAIALVGNPAVIFMDEPTTGMDPKARRFLWDVISSLMMNGRCIVFTSHSMEECEALCTRMAIMVNGKFRCMGSAQHLKSQYGVGYTLIIKLREGAQNKLAELKQYIVDSFPDARLKEEHNTLVQYQLPSANSTSSNSAQSSVSLASIFSRMEDKRDSLEIEDYSVNQTTLEQVFVGFARFQEGGAQP